MVIKIATISAILAVTIVTYLSLDNSYISIDSEGYIFGEHVEIEWSKLCISTEYTWPNLSIPELAGSTCLAGVEVPENEVFAVYISNSGKCQVHRLKGSFLFESNSETRCFRKDEIDGEFLAIHNGVISFGRKDVR